MRTDRQIMALHAAISLRNWHDVEVAANKIRDHDILEASLAAAEAANVVLLKMERDAHSRAAEMEKALKICDRVLHFDLRHMIEFGPHYNQAVKDAADAARAALGEKQ